MRLALPVAMFPRAETIAEAFISESIRHLQDAELLHRRARYAGSVASSMKAAELAVKSAIMYVGGFGLWEKLLTTHRPYTDIKNHEILSELRKSLETIRPAISTELEYIEGFVPNRFGAERFDEPNEANPEYPFLAIDKTSVESMVKTLMPHTWFDQPKSLRVYTAARDVVKIIRESPQMPVVRLSLPRSH